MKADLSAVGWQDQFEYGTWYMFGKAFSAPRSSCMYAVQDLQVSAHGSSCCCWLLSVPLLDDAVVTIQSCQGLTVQLPLALNNTYLCKH